MSGCSRRSHRYRLPKFGLSHWAAGQSLLGIHRGAEDQADAEAVSWAKKVAATGVRGTRSLEYIGLPARPEAAGDTGKESVRDPRYNFRSRDELGLGL